MNNIFENAYFGKPYKTRDGRKAIFQTTYPSQIDSSKTVYSFFTEDSSFCVNEDGKMDFKVDDDVFSYHECHPECDIVSEWEEEISNMLSREEQIKGMAEHFYLNNEQNNYDDERLSKAFIRGAEWADANPRNEEINEAELNEMIK